ncbi:hypothetical protein C1H46_036156 [Malus baccata]|uniref:Uncharacterized protein n=1 Tax=Malus baccata TaxID=106549 RepID=A0A540KVP5_MALBA|nr:hypothetical protein C1H46_036156 [Malus baccata]
MPIAASVQGLGVHLRTARATKFAVLSQLADKETNTKTTKSRHEGQEYTVVACALEFVSSECHPQLLHQANTKASGVAHNPEYSPCFLNSSTSSTQLGPQSSSNSAKPPRQCPNQTRLMMSSSEYWTPMSGPRARASMTHDSDPCPPLGMACANLEPTSTPSIVTAN